MSALGAVPHYVEPVEGRRYKVVFANDGAAIVRGPLHFKRPKAAWVRDGRVEAGGSDYHWWPAEAVAAVELARDLEPVA